MADHAKQCPSVSEKMLVLLKAQMAYDKTGRDPFLAQGKMQS